MNIPKNQDGTFQTSKTANMYFYGVTRNPLKEIMKEVFWKCLE